MDIASRQDLYYIISIVLVLVICAIPVAIDRLIRQEISRRCVRSEIVDVIHGMYLFFAWSAVVQAFRSVSRFLHEGPTPIIVTTALNASRAASGLFVLLLIYRALYGRMHFGAKPMQVRAAVIARHDRKWDAESSEAWSR